MPESSTLRRRKTKLLSCRWVLGPALTFLGVLAGGLVLKEASQFTAEEYRIDQMLAGHRSNMLDALAEFLEFAFGSTYGPLVALIFFGAVWAVTRNAARTATAGFIVAFSCASCWIMKILVSRHSPGEGHLWISYPSGHTAFAVAIVSASYWLVRDTKSANRSLKAGIGLVLAVGVSRLYLGVHYPSDVLAACALSLGSSVFAIGAAPLVLGSTMTDAAFRRSRTWLGLPGRPT